MPSKAKRPCLVCGKPSDGSRCEQHRLQQRRDSDSTRMGARERGYDSRWEKARRAYLAKHPLCLHCQQENRVTVATVVDHIVPHKGDRALFWDSTNWQPLCVMHHNRKTRTQDM